MAVVDAPGPDQQPDIAVTPDPELWDEDLQAKLQVIRERFQIHQTFWSAIHSDALEDDKFVAGDQWSETLRKEREEDGRPVLTYNLMPSFTRQITNGVRQNRPQVKVMPVENRAGSAPRMRNLAGTHDHTMAEIYTGLLRNIEHVSRAKQAYDTALKHAVEHGFGFFMLMPQWSRIDPFVQDLVIKRIKNSYSVTLDPDAQEADYRDAQDAFVHTTIKKSTFRAKYPDATPNEFAGVMNGATYEGWYDSEAIRVVQYFWIEWKDDEAIMLSDGRTEYLADIEDVLDELKKYQGIHILKDDEGKELRKAVKRPICMWQKMTANEILEGPTQLPFSAIPIFAVLGDEQIVDGRIEYKSAIRDAKDAQRSYNYWRTAGTETAALAPRNPWVLTDRQISGYEKEWEEANQKNLPYLTYNHVEGVPPPQRNYPSQIPAAEIQNAVQDGIDMQSIIGLHDASLGRESNEKSGKAIQARQQQGNNATFQFPDNLNRALEQMGRLAVEAIPRIYDTRRTLRIRMADDSEDFVQINQAVKDEETGETRLVHDIAFGKYDVIIETGNSYATLRQEAADLQMELLKVLGPEQASNIVHLIVKNLGVPGSEEVAAVLRKMLPDQLKTEEERLADLPKGVTVDQNGQPIDENGEPWQPPMTPEMQLMAKQQEIDEAKNQAEIAKAQADMAEAEADKIQAQAKIEAAKADTARLQAEMSQLQAQAGEGAQDMAKTMQEIDRIIRQAMQEHETNPEAHKAATAEQIAEAVVDALGRVRGYVDRKIGKAAPGEAANQSPPGGSTESPRPAPAPAASTSTGINLNLEPKPRRIQFQYGEDGNIVSAVPIYEDEAEAS